MATQTWFRTTLAASLTPTATTATLATAPVVTSWRMLIFAWNITEWISFSGVSGNTITGLVRWLSQTADPVTGGTWLAWSAWTQIIMVFMHDNLIDKETAIPIVWFTTTQRNALNMSQDYFTWTYPIIYNTTTTQYEYYNGVTWASFATGTVADASETIAGKVEKATKAQTVAGTDVGETWAFLFAVPSDIAENTQSNTFLYWVDAGGDDTYVVALTPALTDYTTGQILYAKMTTANTGACTVDFWPWAKSIKLVNGNDPADWDVASGRTHSFVYDGTNMVLQDPAVTTTTAITTDPNLQFAVSTQLSQTWSNFTIDAKWTLDSTEWIWWLWTSQTGSIGTAGWYHKIITSAGAGTFWIFYTGLPWTWSQAYYRYADNKDVRVKFRLQFNNSSYRSAFWLHTNVTPANLAAAETDTTDGMVRLVSLPWGWVYFCTSNGSSYQATLLTLTKTDYNDFVIVVNPWTNALLYLNNTFVAAHTTIPSTSATTYIGMSDSGSESLEFYPIHISIEK